MSGNSIKVVVRCRPMNSRETARGDTSIISMSGVSTTIEPPPQDPSTSGNKAHERKAMTFGFDHSYWSAGSKTDPDYASQDTLYNDLGVGLLDHAFAGFNTCIFAYGQTGSGKSYSMMGYGPEKGIIPLTCSELFRRGDELANAGAPYKYTVEVSYIEIYNEKVRDLLNPKNKGNLKVREHPLLGPYVEDLSRLVVGNYDDMISMMDEGNKARTVAATQMNETSSRSHAVFTLILTQQSHDAATDLDAEKVSRISLVDLAGSERANSTGATGARLKEGANINKSLTTLGKVIAALAAASAEPEKGKKKKKEENHIPFRDSVLTWLLKDSLGGNSQTAMIAAIAPSSASYDETLSTLRYADQAKKIKTRAVVNEDPNAKMIRELKEELEMLRTRAAGGGGGAQTESFWDTTIPPEKQMVTYQTKTGELRTVSKAELQDQMQASEKLMQSLNETWESKMEKTEVARKEREAALEELGISVEKGGVGVHTPKKVPHLVNLNEDPLMSEALVYNIKPGKTMVGNVEAKSSAAIRLSGSQILEEHCFFTNENGVVSLTALPESTTIINGKRVPHEKPQMLKSGYRIILGDYHVFRFQNPMEVRLHREAVRSSMNVSISASDLAGIASGAGSPAFRPESPGSTVDQDGIVDWTFAKRELALARLNGQEPGLDTLKDEDLDKLFDNIQKVRTLRKDRTRPESRLSIADDFWERDSNGRHLSSTFTDDTSVDPNGSNPWGGFPSNGNGNGPVGGGTPSSENVREAQDLLVSQKEAYEAKLSSLASTSSTSADREDFEIEKNQMQRSIELISQEMKRLRHLRSSGTVKESLQGFEPTVYSAKEIRLAKGALRKWKGLRTLGMAETVLTHAVKVKEANVISCSLGKKVSYNFTIAEGGSLSIPTSALDTISGLADFEDASHQASQSSSSGVGIKVLDFEHNSVYLWTFDQFLLKLAKMRNVTSLLDKPSYSQHFSSEEPFYDSPPPSYSFIGNALVSLAPLSRRISTSAVSPIFCRFTSEAIGSCRVTISVTSPSPSPPKLHGLGFLSPKSTGSDSGSGSATTTRPSSPMPSSITPGSKLSFDVVVDRIKGPSSIDYSSLHVQFHLSSLAGNSIPSENVFTSSAVNLDKSPSSELTFRRKIAIVVTPEIISHLRQDYLPVEFFAGVRPAYLDRLARWDETREKEEGGKRTSKVVDKIPSNPKSPSTPEFSAMRRSENDFVQEQIHDVSSSVQICELGSSGDYVPSTVLSQGPLDPGAFHLRQGLQRRLVISLSHTSGRSLPWTRIERVTVGQVRLLGANGQVLESQPTPDVELKLSKKGDAAIFHPDGTSTLVADGFWDSSAHDSSFLNRPTASNQRVLVRLTFFVDISTCEELASFSLDAALRIQTRSASGPGLLSAGFFGSARLLNRSNAIFSLRLAPPPTRSTRDLWRLDTSKAYVRGEEALPQGWTPRGVSVVQDHNRLVKQEKLAADVQASEALVSRYSLSSELDPPSSSNEQESQEIIKKAVGLWRLRFGPKEDIDLNRKTSEPDFAALAKILKIADLNVTPKLVPQARLVPRTDIVAKKGGLNILIDAPQNLWVKRFFVLRR
ncbi:kinesin-like protein [Mrakia frigida]|uniref:kinesin-like protein n=1 Tax=Mrakia frigida TaxID=29902 RepID=UPI003FCC2259